jgi:hypothetical protein
VLAVQPVRLHRPPQWQEVIIDQKPLAAADPSSTNPAPPPRGRGAIIPIGATGPAVVPDPALLLHAREGSGERTSVNINAMVEEALNLAYHGARAEKPGFTVTILKSLDPKAGAAELFRQEITRVLLNLISNAFYATTKRTREARIPPTNPLLSPRPATSAIQSRSQFATMEPESPTRSERKYSTRACPQLSQVRAQARWTPAR